MSSTRESRIKSLLAELFVAAKDEKDISEGDLKKHENTIQTLVSLDSNALNTFDEGTETDSWFNTLLAWAGFNGHIELANLFMKYGADPFKKSKRFLVDHYDYYDNLSLALGKYISQKNYKK